MRTLWYRLSHKPANIDDCLDLADKMPISQVCLYLSYSELIREQYFITQLVARFEVKYADETHIVEELCGGYLRTDSEDKKRSEIDCANAKLREFTLKLADKGIMLAKSHQQFEYRLSAEQKPDTRKNPYEKFADTELILRDQLAIDRTVLATERTVLAYGRTCLTLILTGAGFIRLFDSLFSDVTGWILIVLGFIVAAIGFYRFIIMRKTIGTAGKSTTRSQEKPLETHDEKRPNKPGAGDGK